MTVFPSSAADFIFETDVATRQLTITFSAPLQDINDWLKSNPLTADVEPIVNGEKRLFNVLLKERVAELEVNDADSCVKIVCQT